MSYNSIIKMSFNYWSPSQDKVVDEHHNICDFKMPEFPKFDDIKVGCPKFNWPNIDIKCPKIKGCIVPQFGFQEEKQIQCRNAPLCPSSPKGCPFAACDPQKLFKQFGF